MKQIIIIVAILTLLFFGCEWKKKHVGLNDDSKLNIDTTLITIIPYDTSSLHWIFKKSKPTILTNYDLNTIDSLLKICIAIHNIEQEKKFIEFKTRNNKILKSNFIIDLNKYKRQYIAVTDFNGQKQVWVNCFCDDWDTNSRINPIIVMDGGNCYFNLKINLTVGKYYSLITNQDV